MRTLVYQLHHIMKKGKVKFYNRVKEFGFITEHESGKDFFVHATGLEDIIADGDEVTFDIGEGRKGPMAVGVKQAVNEEEE